MKMAFAIAVTSTVLLFWGITFAADTLKSGPQVGETVPGLFHPLNVFNAEVPSNNGKRACLYCQHGLNPVAMVFTRQMTEPLGLLIQKLDAAVVKNKDEKLGAFVVFLTDDGDAAEATLQKLAGAKGVKHVSLAIDTQAGPAKYNLAKEAEVTIVLYNHHEVLANHTFGAGEFTVHAVEQVMSGLPKVIAGD